MFRTLKKFLSLAPLLLATGAGAADLQVEIIPQFNGAPLSFDALKYQTSGGQNISVTRLDFLLSDIALRRADGTWIRQQDKFAFVNLREPKNNFILPNIPSGIYDRIRFHIGLEPTVNHSDSAQYPAGDPLNPEVNELHWGWSGGYIFLALEGGWQDGGKQSGFSYHLANDPQLMTVELAVALDLNSSRDLQLALGVDKIFSAPNQIVLSETNDTTHSRTNDPLALQLRENVEQAFSIIGQASNLSSSQKSNDMGKLPVTLIASNATPYRLTISKFAPRPDLPRDNPLTGEGVALGSKLFFDRRLSANDSQSCASCHHPRESFSERRRFSRGVDGDIGTRNAMPLENLAWKKQFFWDGRSATLREQVLQPVQNPIEMHASLTSVVAEISADKEYQKLFANAFGSQKINVDLIARALEQFLLVQVSFGSKFDHVLNNAATFTVEEQRGFELFNTEYDPRHGQYGADCFHCHGGPLLQSQSFANNGLDATFRDLGRYEASKRAGDVGKFSVPSLRNVAVTAPYMHDGRFRTLEEVVEHYCTGMKRSATLDPNLAKHPDGGVPLYTDDKKALVAFLKTLTDERFLPPTPPTKLAQK